MAKDELELKDELERCSDDEEEEPKFKMAILENKDNQDGENADQEEEHDPEKLRLEYESDIRNGDLSIILSKLEVIGKKKSIYLYKEMVELRDKRNEKVHKYLGVWFDPGKVDNNG